MEYSWPQTSTTRPSRQGSTSSINMVKTIHNLNSYTLTTSKDKRPRMIFNVSRMAYYNRQYTVYVYTDESLLKLQVGIYFPF